MELETAALARRFVPDGIRVRTTPKTIVLSEGYWSTEVETDRLAGVAQPDRAEVIRLEIDRAVASLRAARHGDDR